MGACRLCIVEVSGVDRLLPACTTPVQDGMCVTTNSEKLAQYRRIAIEFLFSERNHQCAVCVSNNHCELQAMAQRLGVTSVRYPYAYPEAAGGRLARALRARSQPLHPVHALRARLRRGGRRARVGRQLARHPQHDCLRYEPALGQSRSCTSCGKCVQVCPTGALAEKGFAVEEMVKQDRNVTRLAARRGGHL